MLIAVFAALCTGLFAGAALYINVAEHPARLSCGIELAIREFRPSYRRAAVMQASLAVLACVSGLAWAWRANDAWIMSAAILIGAVVPFTLIVIRPTNDRLLDESRDLSNDEAAELLGRWGRLHAVRTALSVAAFVLLLMRVLSVASQRI